MGGGLREHTVAPSLTGEHMNKVKIQIFKSD